MDKSWLALMIGNSRWHWAAFQGDGLVLRWDTEHLDRDVITSWAVGNSGSLMLSELMLPASWPQAAQDWLRQQEASGRRVSLCLASVVPEQTRSWQAYSALRILELQDVPLLGMYPSLGIDRALAVWGAGQRYGFPQLVIDAGTALTFTGADTQANFVGGAILPGLGTQFQVLANRTAQLPGVQAWGVEELPPRWAMGTEVAIASGVLYTVLAGIQGFVQDWQQRFLSAAGRGEGALGITLTGGDARLIGKLLHQENPILASRIRIDDELIFWGIQHCFQRV